MNKKELTSELQKYVGGAGFIRKYQLANYLGAKDPNTVNKYLAGLDRVGRDYYFIPDVAAALIDG